MTIDDWRRRIDELDRKLVELLNERSRCALEIGRIKHEAGLPVYQPDREKEVLANAEQHNQGPLPGAAIRRLFERIVDEARSVERHAVSGDNRTGERSSGEKKSGDRT
jgi:chorismate mutase